jgi:signal transduction histidine kinase
MALTIAILFIIIASTALASVYYITFNEIEEQTDRELNHELTELQASYVMQGKDALYEVVEQREIYGRHLQHYYAILHRDPILNTGSDRLINAVLASPLFGPDQPVKDKPQFFYVSLSDENILRIAFKTISPDITLIAGLAQKSTSELQEHVLTAIFYAVLVTIFLALAAGFYMGKRVIDRINRLDSDLAEVISADFKQGLQPPESHDEFSDLTEKLNRMIKQVESLLSGMKQVTDNIAHDLRSPLTRLRNKLEVTLLQARDPEEYEQAMSSAIEDCNTILQTFNALLSIAKAEAGVKNQDWQNVDMSLLISELAELYTAVAEEKHITLSLQLNEDVILKGNRQLLAQALSNLIENAIKYTPSEGKVTIACESINERIFISVCDNGPGIPDADKARVLERFQRLDTARSSPGSGLGLSLVKAVAKLHDAELSLSDNHPGLCACIELHPVKT